jgi:ATP-binding cassette, subfamily F, member 3
MYLRASNLSKAYGHRRILSGVSLVINEGERLALVGPNGAGKSTLLRVLAGLEPPDAGAVEVSPPTARVGYLPQLADPSVVPTAAEVAGEAGRAWRLAEAAAEASEELAAESGSPEALARLDALWREFEQAGGYPMVEALERALADLGVEGVEASTPVSSLSGGTRTRVALAGLLALSPDALLLDEPTNHLDLPTLLWLEEFVVGYPGAVLVVSHDRAFLDRVARRVLELDPSTHGLRSYPGDYTDYAEAKARERESEWKAYERQQERIERLEGNIRAAESRARAIQNRSQNFYYRKKSAKVARTAVVMKRRLDREVEREGRQEKPVAGWRVKADFGEAAASGQDALIVRGLSAGYDGTAVVEGIDLLVRRGERVVLVGPNGVGKTTLLRTIVGELKPLAGEVRLGEGVSVGYFPQGQEGLPLDLMPLQLAQGAAELDETAARTYLHRFLFAGEEVSKPVRSLSYGERARLILALLVLRGANLLVLDEPLSHLDLPSRDAFERAVLEQGGTVLAVFHDRYAIDRLATRVIELARPLDSRRDGTI